jgi:hypothetical protein
MQMSLESRDFVNWVERVFWKGIRSIPQVPLQLVQSLREKLPPAAAGVVTRRQAAGFNRPWLLQDRCPLPVSYDEISFYLLLSDHDFYLLLGADFPRHLLIFYIVT